jgi:hypothetical protein
MHKVLMNQNDSILFWLARILCNCCWNKDDFWQFERAAEPSDIIWENMGFTPCQQSFRQFVSSCATFVSVGISFALIYAIKNQAKSVLNEAIEDGTFSDETYSVNVADYEYNFVAIDAAKLV